MYQALLIDYWLGIWIIVNMEIEKFSHGEDNLYKYIVIIGLSLILIPPLGNSGLINNLQRTIDLRLELQKNLDEVKANTKEAEEIEAELETAIDHIETSIRSQIREMNLFFPDGKQVETYHEIPDFNYYIGNLLREINDHIDNNSDSNLIFEKLFELQNAYGVQEDFEGLLSASNEHTDRLIRLKEFMEDNLEELLNLQDRIQSAKNENNRLSKMFRDFEYELKKITIEYNIYSRERNLINFFRITGAVLIISGGLLWYFKIQRHIDKRYSKSQSKKYKRKTGIHFLIRKINGIINERK